MAKLSISTAWDESKAVLARDGKLIGTVALALLVLPGVILNLVMPKAPAGGLPPPGPWMLVALVVIIVTLIGQLSILRLAMGPHVSVGEAIAHGARRLLPYLGATLLWLFPILLVGSLLSEVLARDPQHPSPAAAIGLLVLTLAGIYFAVRFALGSAVASAEPVGPLKILERSWQLSRGSWWRLFAFLALIIIVALVLLIAVGAVAALIARMTVGELSPLSVGGLLVSLAGQLVSAFIAVILFVMLARIYVQRAGGGGAEVGVPSSGT